MRAQAREILQRGATDAVFEQYLTDKGFTEAWLTELTQQAIDVLEGRVRDQLLRLRRAVEEARPGCGAPRGAARPRASYAHAREGRAAHAREPRPGAALTCHEALPHVYRSALPERLTPPPEGLCAR